MLNIRSLFSYLLVSLITLIVIGHVVLIYLIIPGPLEDKKIVIIEPRTPIKTIAHTLYTEGIINHQRSFEIIATLYSRLKNHLKSGEYEFTKHITPLQVIRILSSGKSVVHKLVIPEGTTVSEIISKLNSEPRLLGPIQENIKEGFLMPSTYFYTFRDNRSTIISQMKNLMSQTLDELLPQLSPSSPLKSRLDVLILASIVEKEAALDAEKPHIAGVFLNRLKLKMKLQADPTTIYAITMGRYKLDHPLTKAELRIKSPYNTYHTAGLPPTPISCPGRKSIEAVIKPLETKDLYFVVDGLGGHRFSSTLEQHTQNIATYKKSIVSSNK